MTAIIWSDCTVQFPAGSYYVILSVDDIKLIPHGDLGPYVGTICFVKLFGLFLPSKESPLAFKKGSGTLPVRVKNAVNRVLLAASRTLLAAF